MEGAGGPPLNIGGGGGGRARVLPAIFIYFTMEMESYIFSPQGTTALWPFISPFFPIKILIKKTPDLPVF